MPTLTLTRQDVRRLAIARQHLADATPAPMLDVIRDLGCLQLDPIRAVERTHLLVLWSRLGQFDVAELDKLRWQDKTLFEYWAHAASMVLTEEYPLFSWGMNQRQADPRRTAKYQKWFDETSGVTDLRDHILYRLQQEGPLFSRDFGTQEGMRWESRWSSGRFVGHLLDYLWTNGEIMVAERKGNQKRWGLAASFFPEWTPQEQWSAEEVCRFAAQKAIRALGAATAKQIKYHYTRGMYPELTAVLTQLVKEEILIPVTVSDGSEPLSTDYYLHADDLPLLRQLQSGDWQPRTTLLSPFDNLICDRDRTEQLFDFYFRIEIYVPKAKRQYGYYVLPILHGDRLIGRLDPKMDRKTNTLHIYNVYAQPNSPKNKKAVQAIGKAVASLASFLGAKQIQWGNVPSGWEALKQTG
ncbi:Putative cytoplasmic protein clustered with trehalase [hydrothermal vent metagenome]|uniref:Cytoplasmic protein clustered with trehalase n=1 Tax=hydrothermal vent metagenome TaxID=652676 RepID=A0A3B0VNS2_9ZZZZ